MLASGSMTAIKKGATYADLCAVPNFVDFGGELLPTPRPHSPCSCGSAIGVLIGGPFQFGITAAEAAISPAGRHFGPTFSCLLAGWRIERVGDWADAAYLTVAPDWLCEVLSPSSERIASRSRAANLRTEGVRHSGSATRASSRSLFELEGGRWSLTTRDEGEARSNAPFDAIELEVANCGFDRRGTLTPAQSLPNRCVMLA